ncbi:MAG TPA: hypothetical protein VI300_05540 [Solirubrobacter sp.]
MSGLAPPGTVLPQVGRPQAPSQPYPGLEPFRFADSGIFAARDAEVERLVRLITMYRGVMLYGESGAGKSSVVNAGLLPRMLRDGLWPHRVRVQPRVDQELVLDPVRLSWADDEVLPSAFAGSVLAARTLEQTVEEVTKRDGILLVFDQFEELITLFDGDAEALACQARVLEAVLRLLRNPTMPVKLLFVFREDYLAALDPLIAEKPELTDQALRLVPPPVECATQIIRAPFERFHDAFDRELSPEVAARVAGALRTRSRAGALNLSELQVVCARLWAAPDAGELLDAQGVEGLLEDFLNARLATFDADEVGDLAVALLTRLVTVSGTRNVVSHDDLLADGAEETGRTRELAASVLRRLEREAHLVRSERRRDVVTYEIVSEFLVPFIAALKAERDAAREASEALEAAQAAHMRELASRRRVMLWVGGAFALIAVLAFAALAAYALNQRSAAIRDRDVASANELSSAADTQKTGDSALARNLGLKALRQRWTPTAESALRSAVSIPVPARTLTLAGDPVAADSEASIAVGEQGRYATGFAVGAARVWDARTGELVMKVPRADRSVAPTLSSDGRLLLVPVGKAVEVFDVASHKLLRKLALPPTSAGLWSVEVNGDASLVMVRGYDDQYDDYRQVWSLQDGTPVWSGPRAASVASARFGAGATVLAMGRNSVESVDLRSHRTVWRAQDQALSGIAADGATVALSSVGGLELRDARSGRVQQHIKTPGFTPYSTQFAEDAAVVVADGEQRMHAAKGERPKVRRMIFAWSTSTGRPLGPSIKEGTNGSEEIAVSPDGRLLATSTAGDVVLWDVATGVAVAKLRGDTGSAAGRAAARLASFGLDQTTLRFTADGNLLTAGADGRLRTWDIDGARAPWVRDDHSGDVWTSEFSPRSDRLATGGADGRISMISVATGKRLFTRRPSGRDEVFNVAFDPSGDRLATLSENGAVGIWDAFTGKRVLQVRKPSTHSGGTGSLTYSPDGTRLLAAWGPEIAEWRVADGQALWKPKGNSDINFVQYSPRGVIAIADSDLDTVRIHDPVHLKRRQVLHSGEGMTMTMAFSPDGRYLAAGTESGATVVWDMRTGRRVRVLEGSAESATMVRFTSDGRHLAVAGEDGVVRLWDWRPQTSSIVASSFSNGWSVALSPDRRFIAGTGKHSTTVLLRCPGCAPLDTVKATAKTGARRLTDRERGRYLHEGERQRQDPN